MLKFGISQVELTPDFPVGLSGYPGRDALTDQVEEPVELSCAVLKRNEKTLVFIMIDSLGINHADCQRLYKAIETRYGISFPEIVISASHSHFAPNSAIAPILYELPGENIGVRPWDERFYKHLEEKIFAALKEAFASMEEVNIKFAAVPLPHLLFNRRTIKKSSSQVENNYDYPADPAQFIFNEVDDELSLWKFKRADGTIAGIIGRFSCHAVTGGKNKEHISGDYPYYFRKEINRIFNCPCGFILGAAGDGVPLRRNKDSRELIGKTLAQSAVMAELTFADCPDTGLDAHAVEIPVMLRPDIKLDPEFYQQKINDFTADDKNNIDLVYDTVNRLCIALNYQQYEFDLPLQIIKLGGKTLIGMPYEVLSQIGLKLQASCPDARLISLTGGYNGYLPLKEDFPLGGYETVAALFCPDTGDRFLDVAIRSAKECECC
jgi:hypothetical protein